MKIILSRKGFDSVSGGGPSPILPDGTLLSMPIPSDEADRYAQLSYGGRTYADMLAGLYPKKTFERCHLDPDIRAGIRTNPADGWEPAFGQTGSAAGILRNVGVTEGDLFLFFGLFRKAEPDKMNFLRFVRGEKPMHVIYGYLQIGAVLKAPEKISRYRWHPHADAGRYGNNNILYLPDKRLSFLPNLPGYGVLNLQKQRILTMEGESPACWRELPFLMPSHVLGNRKNSARKKGLFYKGQWQELVLKPDPDAERWAKQIILGETD